MTKKITINTEMVRDRRYVQGILDTLEPGDTIQLPAVVVRGTIVAPQGVIIEGLSDSRNYPRYQVVDSNL